MMEALTSSLTKIFAKCDFEKALLCMRSAATSRSGIGFLQSPPIRLTLSLAASIRCRAIHSLPLSKSQVELEVETPESGLQGIDPSKTVHLKFQLQMDCQFGERFLVVGDDPILGSWNPSDAVPMMWSDDNKWSVELDMPVDKPIQYKFLLRKITGDVVWQPGPDRTFHPWEAKSVVTVHEDWENAAAQRISEEQIVHFDDEEAPFINKGTSYLDEELLPGVVVSDHGAAAADDRQLLNVDDIAFENDYALTDANKTDEVEDRNVERRENRRKIDESDEDDAEDEGTLLVHEHGTVLVPGLSVRPSEAAPVEELQKSFLSDATLGADAANGHNLRDIQF
ncbi:hypothetical protein Nepgr_000168 [Nepenthes gracilis]|uniref:CBM20 domain-containing protein n=1 Tax=Nepenthes gracilis TaxID=150966 RepID=A0AAD3P5T7_NEPGR|nr:hypothetical protein Nepgr_000168 [Nepenthes gracilis]